MNLKMKLSLMRLFSPLPLGFAIALSVKHLATDWRPRVRGSSAETQLCTLMAVSECKTHRGRKVLPVLPFLGIPKLGSHPRRRGSKF